MVRRKRARSFAWFKWHVVTLHVTSPSPPAGPTQPNHSSKMNPIIADVVSLANGSAAQPTAGTGAALTGQSDQSATYSATFSQTAKFHLINPFFPDSRFTPDLQEPRSRTYPVSVALMAEVTFKIVCPSNSLTSAG